MFAQLSMPLHGSGVTRKLPEERSATPTKRIRRQAQVSQYQIHDARYVPINVPSGVDDKLNDELWHTTV